MMLNEKGKDELREKIIEQLKNIPDGQRVHLDKELLESLLFKTITYNKNTNEKLKLPTWSGDFLRKIDLSEVSFEDVAWSLIFQETWDYPEEEYEKYMDEETYNEMPNILPKLKNNELVNYSMTNAKIDFTKSFEFKKTGKITLWFCDFEGVDLSNNDMSKLEFAGYCDLSDTGIALSPEMFDGRIQVFVSTDLQNLDLSKFSVDAIDMICEHEVFLDCDFTNTGLNISLNPERKKWNENDKSYDEIDEDEIKEIISRSVGCYINSQKILSDEEKQAIAQTKREEYEAYKQGLLNSVSKSIEEQSGGMKL